MQKINRVNNIAKAYRRTCGRGNISPSHIQRRARKHPLRVQPNMSNHRTHCQDNSKCKSVGHRQLGVSSHGVWQRVHGETLVHAMHHTNTVHLDKRPAECCQKVDNGRILLVRGCSRKTKRGAKIRHEEKAMVAAHSSVSLHGPALAL